MVGISLIGASGSIGSQVKEIVRRYPERYRLVALTVNTNTEALLNDIKEFKPVFVGVADTNAYNLVRRQLDAVCTLRHSGGENALTDAASVIEADTVFVSVVGMCGLKPVVVALENSKQLALANKEALVAGGDLVMKLAKEKNIRIMPVDSEHSAIFQCLHAGERKDLKRIVLTASGGPFRTWKKEDFKNITLKDALRHPTWNMGQKITIDSATLMNKGLEIIEARWLFDTLNIDCVIHPQSIIHSFIEFKDHSVLAQMSYPTMEIPISLALSYPERLKTVVPPLDFNTLKTLDFEQADREKFKCLSLAERALGAGGFYPVILNTANERAVELFLKGKIAFIDIPNIIEDALSKSYPDLPYNVEGIYEMDKAVRRSINA